MEREEVTGRGEQEGGGRGKKEKHGERKSAEKEEVQEKLQSA